MTAKNCTTQEQNYQQNLQLSIRIHVTGPKKKKKKKKIQRIQVTDAKSNPLIEKHKLLWVLKPNQ
jgi:hypothetical protein